MSAADRSMCHKRTFKTDWYISDRLVISNHFRLDAPVDVETTIDLANIAVFALHERSQQSEFGPTGVETQFASVIGSEL